MLKLLLRMIRPQNLLIWMFKAAMPTTLKDLTTELSQKLPRHEVRMMIEYVTGYGQEVLITAPDKLVSADQQKQIKKIIERRARGEPLPRILGVREFWGLEFEVTPDVLDPRPDTETLIEAALAFLRGASPQAGGHNGTGKPLKILDLGTGSGCIPISLLSELPHATAVATDISAEALMVAKRNAQKHKMSDRMKFIQSDWFEKLEDQRFDLIVSNPPYISDRVIPNLDVEVKNHDPILALSGGDSGLECYKIIFLQLNKYLSEGGRAFLEIGFDQLESISRLVDDSSLYVCDSMFDIAGNPRVVEITRKD